MKSILMSAVALTLAIICGCSEPLQTADKSVIDNLQSAYGNEINASIKYKNYALKAAEAGYKDVATLFHAASKSASLSALNHARVLKSFGIEAQNTPKTPDYINVRESLLDARRSEIHKTTTMYPDFIKHAKAKKTPEKVINTFSNASQAGQCYVNFCEKAAKNLIPWTNGDKSFYVCNICGYTTAKLPPENCATCQAPAADFFLFESSPNR